MAYVYMLLGTSGRYYIGASENADQRLEQHNSGRVHSSRRLGLPLQLVAKRQFHDMAEALATERMLKNWKSPMKSLAFLHED